MSPSPEGHPRSRRAWLVLTVLLGLETAAGLIALIPLGTGFIGAGADQPGQRISVLLAALIAILWIVITFVGALRSRASWARGSAITLHVLMFAAGTGVLQYALASTEVGWGLVLCAFIGFFSALLAKPQPAAVAPGDPGD